MPGLAMPELELLTRWTLWLVAVDDLLDDLDLPDEPVADWVWRFLGDLPSNPDDADPLRAAVGSIQRDLSRYPLYPALGARWRADMAGMVSGMLQERDWSRAPLTGQPGFEEYLRNAMTTIGVYPCTVTAAILAGEPGAISEFSALAPVIQAAARCFRLANDLGTDARERAEGTLNAVSVLQRDHLARRPAGRRRRPGRLGVAAPDMRHGPGLSRFGSAHRARSARDTGPFPVVLHDLFVEQVGDCDALSAALLQELQTQAA